MAGPVSPILDNFTRANEDPIAGNWSGPIAPGLAQLRVVSNTLRPNATNFGGSWWSAQTFAEAAECYITVTTLPAAGEELILYVRLQSAGTASLDGYFLRLDTQVGSNNDVFDLWVMTNGAGSVLASHSATDWVNGDKMWLKAVGTQFEGWRYDGATWTMLVSATDSTYTGAGNIAVTSDPGSAVLDDFGGGSPDTGLAWFRA